MEGIPPSSPLIGKAALRRSTPAARTKDDADLVIQAADPSKDSLRRSALASASTEAQQISTLHNGDLNSILSAVSHVVYLYASREDELAKDNMLDLFDEAFHPLDDSGVWTAVPSVHIIRAFLSDIQESLQLDDVCVVTALVMLERAVFTSAFVIAPRTWRVALLIAMVIACKVVFDEDIYLGDFRDNLPWLDVDLSGQEAVFLNLIDYTTLVKARQYAQYYFALGDLMRPPKPAPPARRKIVLA